jgi:hypothetical protein
MHLVVGPAVPDVSGTAGPTGTCRTAGPTAATVMTLANAHNIEAASAFPRSSTALNSAITPSGLGVVGPAVPDIVWFRKDRGTVDKADGAAASSR